VRQRLLFPRAHVSRMSLTDQSPVTPGFISCALTTRRTTPRMPPRRVESLQKLPSIHGIRPPSERQVDTVPAHQGMMSLLERHDAVIPKRQSERDRHDRRLEIPLVLVLVKRQTGSRLVSVDETRVGSEAVESRPRCRLGSEVGEHVGHRRPATPALRVMAS